MHEHPVHRRVDLVEDPALGQRRAHRHEAAGQGLRHGDDVRLDILVLIGEEPAGPAQTGLHLIADQQRAVVMQQLGGRGEEPVGRHPDAFALDRLDDERRDVALAQLGLERVGVAERDRDVREQRVEALAELRRAVDRQRAGGQAVEGVAAEQDPLPARRVPGELQRGLHRLGAAVAEVHAVELGRLGQQPLGEQAGQQRAVELNHAGQLCVEHVVQRLADNGVVVPHPEDAEASQEVGVPVAVAVPQVGALGPLVHLVESDGVQHAGQLRVQIPCVQVITLPAPGGQEGRQVKSHPRIIPGRSAPRRAGPECPVPPDAAGS